MPQSPPSMRFFFNDTATTEIYTLSLHDALPISMTRPLFPRTSSRGSGFFFCGIRLLPVEKESRSRSEEHTSELQSPDHLVCLLLLEKKYTNLSTNIHQPSTLQLRTIQKDNPPSL